MDGFSGGDFADVAAWARTVLQYRGEVEPGAIGGRCLHVHGAFVLVPYLAFSALGSVR
jgi:hypothetical protein